MKRAAAALALAWLLCVPGFAVDLAAELFDSETLGRAVPPAAAEALEELRPEDAELNGGLARLWDYACGRFDGALRETLRPAAAIAAVTVLCGAAECFVSTGKTGFNAVSLGGCLAVAVIGVEDVHSVLALGTDTLTALADFSRVLLPTLTTAAAATGAVGSAGASCAAAALFSDLLLTAAQNLILPMICAYVAAAVSAAVLDDRRLDGAIRFLQWAAKALMRLLVLGFTAYMSITGVVAGAADAAAVKAAKAAISTALPVVGKLLSDASETLVAGAGLIRSAVGVFGLLVCLAAVILPVLRLGLRYLLFRAAASVCSGIAGDRLTGLIGALGSAYGLLLGLVGSAAAIEFLAIISLIRTVVY